MKYTATQSQRKWKWNGNENGNKQKSVNGYTGVLDTSKIVMYYASCQGVVGLSALSLNSRLLNELIMYIFFDNIITILKVFNRNNVRCTIRIPPGTPTGRNTHQNFMQWLFRSLVPAIATVSILESPRHESHRVY